MVAPPTSEASQRLCARHEATIAARGLSIASPHTSFLSALSETVAGSSSSRRAVVYDRVDCSSRGCARPTRAETQTLLADPRPHFWDGT